ncbi:phage tail tube protein [Sphingomonas canadensis]|uniref:Phage tail tube protein n=1 Tax=Sphingomonas canadensis TaxID=1219257 RepID=A0ABW3H4L4_9SPHN|nr:phage tail tube protein [Sphingomonas canadensis]MCW3835969.1 phage tail tube protein [Sphingomonas canadensis]
MANPNQVTGRARIKINGAVIPTGKGNTVLEPGGSMREPVEGDYATGSFKESAKDAKLTFAALAQAGFSPQEFGALTDATVMVEFDTGVTYIISHAYAESAPPVKTDGTADCVIYGPTARELK